MATQPPPPTSVPSGPIPTTAAPMNTPSTVHSEHSPSIPSRPRPQNWDGDRMLHVYMLDYCKKRGFTTVVTALSEVTNTQLIMPPPIDAPQGLLYEWWVVFWDIFTAKNETGGSRDAVSYAKNQQIRSDQLRNPPWNKPPQHPGSVPMVLHPGHPMSMNGVMPQQHPTGVPIPVGPHPGHVGPGGQPPPQQPPLFGQPNGVMGNQPPPPPHDQQSPNPAPNMNGPQPYPPQQPGQRQSVPPQRGLSQPQPSGPSSQHQSPHMNAMPPQGINPGQQPPQHPGHPPPAHNNPAMMPRQPAQIGQRPHGQPNGPGHPIFATGSPASVQHGPTPSPQIPQLGHPAHPQNQQNQMNGVPGGTPSQQFAVPGMGNPPRPQSRSATPSGMGPGISSSPSRNNVMQRPPSSHSQIPPGQPGGFNAIGGLPQVPPQQLDMALKQCGFAGRDFHTLNPDEKRRVVDALRVSNRNTPRIPSAANPAAGVPGTPNMNIPGQPAPPQAGFGNQARPPDMHPYPPPGPQHTAIAGKRPGSPSAVPLESSPRDSSPPDRKRARRNSQTGAGLNAVAGFAPGAPGGANPSNMPGPAVQNGVPGMTRPPSQPGGRAVPPAVLPNGMNPGINPPPIAINQQLRPNQHATRFSAMVQPTSKPPGMMANPHPSGLPIPIPDSSIPGNGSVAGRLPPHMTMTQNKIHPSPSMSAAKTPGAMPPPSHTPQPVSKDKIKEETPGPSSLGDGALASNKSSPASKPAPANPFPTTINPTQTPTPSTPAPLGGALGNSGMPFATSVSQPSPTPSAILASANAQNHTPNPGSRPGSSANTTIPVSGAANALSSRSLGGLPFSFQPSIGGTEMYPGLEDYNIDRLAGDFKPEDLAFPDFDEFLNFSLTSSATDDDATGAS